MGFPTDDANSPIEIASLPIWTPASVRRAIENAERDTTVFRPILRRLAFDQRMEAVWSELRKRSKSGRFLHQAQPRDKSNPGTDEHRQSAALSEVFLFVLITAYEKYPVVKSDEIEKAKSKTLFHVDALRAVASDMDLAIKEGKLGLTETFESKALAQSDRLALLRVALWLENYTRALRQANDPLMVAKHRGDPLQRGVLISIANKLKQTFGKRLDRTAAALASVALAVTIGARPARSALTKKSKSRGAKAKRARKSR
jgi:hypothetical protein